MAEGSNAARTRAETGEVGKEWKRCFFWQTWSSTMGIIQKMRINHDGDLNPIFCLNVSRRWWFEQQPWGLNQQTWGF
jgi:hypothetical protein